MLQCGELNRSLFETLTCTVCGQKEIYCDVHKQVQDQLVREDLSTVMGSGPQRRTEQCDGCFLSQLVNRWWADERKTLVL